MSGRHPSEGRSSLTPKDHSRSGTSVAMAHCHSVATTRSPGVGSGGSARGISRRRNAERLPDHARHLRPCGRSTPGQIRPPCGGWCLTLRSSARGPDSRNVEALLRRRGVRRESPPCLIAWRAFSYSVGAAGFEPATSWSQTRRATGLRHTPILLASSCADAKLPAVTSIQTRADGAKAPPRADGRHRRGGSRRASPLRSPRRSSSPGPRGRTAGRSRSRQCPSAPPRLGPSSAR